jgi:WD40 repeat protein
VKETASRLGLTEGAVKGHVERGRARLQERLVGRGLTLSAGLAVADATRGCLWAAPAKGLVASTVKAAVAFAEGQKGPLAGISPAVVHLARSALTGTIWLKVKVALVAVALVSMSVLGAGGLMPSEGASQADIPSAGPSRAEQPDGNVAKALNHQAAPQPPIAKKLPHVEAQLGHSPEVKALAFSPDRKQVLTGSADGTGQLWDMAARQDIRHFQWHTRAVQAVAYSPDGKLVLSSDGTLRLGNATTGKKIRNIGEPSTTTASAAVSPDGKQVLAGHLDFFSLRPEQSLDNKVLLWDVDSGKVVRSFVWKADTTWSILMTVAFSPDGKFVLTGGGEPTTGRAGLIENNMARLWDASTGKESRKFEGHKALIASLTFSADGKQVLTGSWDSTARLWDVATGKEVRKFEGQPARVTSVAISPDGKLVLTAPARGPARLWEVASGKEIRALVGQNQEPRSSPILSAVFTPDGKQVLTGSQDSTMRLWDCASGRELCSLLAFRDSTWAVLDSAGRYDSSNDGDSKWLYGVVGEATKTVPIMQLKERCYDPGLLAKHLGFNKKPLRGVDVTK